MILTVLYLFYFQDIKKLKELHTSIRQNQALVDKVQATAIQMTDLAYVAQALTFKSANKGTTDHCQTFRPIGLVLLVLDVGAARNILRIFDEILMEN